MAKYQLSHLLNNYVTKSIITSKYTWKKIVNTTIHNKEQIMWQTRMDTDRDFECFKHVHTSLRASVP